MGMGVTGRELIAKRAAQEIGAGMVVNLGIGIPSLVPQYIENKDAVYFHAENGILGIDGVPEKGEADENLCNAGGFPVTLREGGSYFDSAEAFAIIRRGKIDMTILGALQVSETGDLANWIVPGKKVPGIGGAMELAAYAKKVIITMSHCNKAGESKLIKECILPLTASDCVDMVITEMGVFEWIDRIMYITELFPGYSLEEVRRATAADFRVAPTLI
ncbi:MAG: 3-oxoacid CoA-transferase subunit B [Bacillus sp. (in: firmicutes)]